jgi:phosphoglycolate phosphatase
MPSGSLTRRLFLDLDGTLVDSRRRQYELFLELGRPEALSFEEYWRCKRAGINQGEMLRRYCALPEARLAEFKSSWLDAIEAPERLEADQVISGVPDFLGKAAAHFELYLVTGRQHYDRLVTQMKKLGIHERFTGILNTEQRRSKVDLVRSRVSCASGDVFVGDMGEDIVTGKELGLYTVGVTSGAYAAESLAKYGPDLIVGSVAELDPAVLGVK